MPSALRTVGHLRKEFWKFFDRPWRIFVGLTGVAGTGIALFLLFRASGDLRTLGLPPSEIIGWVDRHGELRNAPAFALLAIPFLLLARGAQQRRRVILGLAFFVATTEFGQLAISTRTFDTSDILLGWIGLAFSWSAAEALVWCTRKRGQRIQISRSRSIVKKASAFQ